MVWARKIVVLVCVAVTVGIAILYLHMATPLYTGELKVTPTTNARSPTIGSTGGLGGLAAIAGFSGSGGEPTKFDLFLEMLTTRALADELATDPKIMRTIFSTEWNEQTGRWSEPKSHTSNIRHLVGAMVGERQLPWQPPSGRRLQQHIAKNLNVTRQTQKNPVTYIRYDSPDPRFSEYFLDHLSSAADRAVRRRVLTEGRAYLTYLEGRLPNIFAADQRRALIDIMSEQERVLMMASAGVSFAAARVERPLAPRTPTWPRVPVVLALGVIAGAVIGAVLALVRRI